MKYVYAIEINGCYFDEPYNYTLDKCFTTYELAEKFLLEHFERQDSDVGDYFTLKDGHEYLTTFDYGDSAVIKTLELVEESK